MNAGKGYPSKECKNNLWKSCKQTCSNQDFYSQKNTWSKPHDGRSPVQPNHGTN